MVTISPTLFEDGPVLRTWFICGPGHYGADLLFSGDERLLVVKGANGRLDIWDIVENARVYSSGERFIHKVIESKHLGGFLAVADNDVLFLELKDCGIREQHLFAGLPKIDSEESVSLLALGERLAIGTSGWVNSYDLLNRKLLTNTVIPKSANGRIPLVRIRPFRQTTVVRLISSSYLNAERDYLQRLLTLDGIPLAELSLNVPGVTLLRAGSDACLAVVPSASTALVVLDSGSDLLRLCEIEPYDPEMALFLSQDGSIIAGANTKVLVIWQTGTRPRLFESVGIPYYVYLSNDGRYVLVTYCSGQREGSRESVGVLSTASGELVGRCTGHLSGCPSAYSTSNRYFATVMTDSNWDYVRGKPSGTIVLTEVVE